MIHRHVHSLSQRHCAAYDVVVVAIEAEHVRLGHRSVEWSQAVDCRWLRDTVLEIIQSKATEALLVGTNAKEAGFSGTDEVGHLAVQVDHAGVERVPGRDVPLRCTDQVATRREVLVLLRAEGLPPC